MKYLQFVENSNIDSDDELFYVMQYSILMEASTPKPSAKKRKKTQITSSWKSETHSCIWEYSFPDQKDQSLTQILRFLAIFLL